MSDEQSINEAVNEAVRPLHAEIERLKTELANMTIDRDLYRREVRGLLSDLGKAEKALEDRPAPGARLQCPIMCPPSAAVYGYALGTQCQADAGHSTYRNVVGHDFPRASIRRDVEGL